MKKLKEEIEGMNEKLVQSEDEILRKVGEVEERLKDNDLIAVGSIL